MDLRETIIAIIANGEVTRSAAAMDAVKSANVIIAVDGGAENCYITGITPDFILGDFDSITDETREHFPTVKFIHLADQDSTDMEKALSFARSYTPGRLIVLSALGRRMDHSSANLMFLAEFNTSVPVEIYDNHGKMTILNPGVHRILGRTNRIISFFSIRPLVNLTLRGFRYPLHNNSYDPFFVGISNVCESEECEVSFDQGILFMYEITGNG